MKHCAMEHLVTFRHRVEFHGNSSTLVNKDSIANISQHKTVNLLQSRFYKLKNRSMPKKQEAVRTAVQPHGSENRDQTVSHGSLWIWTFKKKKKKNTETQNKKKHNCWEEQADLTLLHSQNTSQIIQTQNKIQFLQ